MKRSSLALLLTGIGSGLLFLGIRFTFPSPTFLSPISQTPILFSPPTHDPSYIIYGFLPYWNINRTHSDSLALPTHLAYFAIEPVYDGSIKTMNTPAEVELGWRWLGKEATKSILQAGRSLGQQTHLVVTLFDDQVISHLAHDTNAQSLFISQLDQLINTYHFTGLNLDYEPQTPPSASTGAELTNFFQRLDRHLDLPDRPLELVLDVFAKSGESDPGLLKAWHLSFDYLVLMTYDYHRSSSSIAGPISPLYTENGHAHHIMKNLTQVSRVVPLHKIVLGLPFYAYQWQTTQTQFGSPTFPGTGKMIPLHQIDQLLNQPGVASRWHSISLTPWATFTEADLNFQIHFENVNSLTQKIGLVKQSGLAGVAIWALGYEGQASPIWEPILSLKR